MAHWGDFVAAQTKQHGALAIGIDPVFDDIPNCFKQNANTPVQVLSDYVDFLFDASADLVGFVKFQSAFFEAFGADGIAVLARGIAAFKRKGVGVVLDAKRGDIGTTAAAYARAFLTPRDAGGTSDLEVDCLTVNPFLGPETLEPFVDCARRFGKGLFVLAKTSNPGAGWLQDKAIDGVAVSDRIADLINGWSEETKGASGLSCVGAVVGVTFPSDGVRLRQKMPSSILLAPGLGPQGGKVEDIAILHNGTDGSVMVPVSRGITKPDDLTVTRDPYAALIRERITMYRGLACARSLA